MEPHRQKKNGSYICLQFSTTEGCTWSGQKKWNPKIKQNFHSFLLITIYSRENNDILYIISLKLGIPTDSLQIVVKISSVVQS